LDAVLEAIFGLLSCKDLKVKLPSGAAVDVLWCAPNTLVISSVYTNKTLLTGWTHFCTKLYTNKLTIALLFDFSGDTPNELMDAYL